jgi:hypothetical protein
MAKMETRIDFICLDTASLDDSVIFHALHSRDFEKAVKEDS